MTHLGEGGETLQLLITLAKTLGKNDVVPKIWLAAPLMNGGSPGSPSKPYGMNEVHKDPCCAFLR